MIRGIKHIGITVTDLGQAEAFSVRRWVPQSFIVWWHLTIRIRTSQAIKCPL